jgi:hypothetical protein
LYVRSRDRGIDRPAKFASTDRWMPGLLADIALVGGLSESTVPFQLDFA